MFNKKTKIVCTIGPASESIDTLKELIKSGLNVCRLNFSHGNYEEHGKRIDNIKAARNEMKLPIAILLDTKGPEIRTGKFSSPEVNLVEGQNFIITMEEVLGDETKCTVSYKELVNDVKPGNQILIDDGLVGLAVQEIKGQEILCIVQNAGTIKDNKGVNVPNVKINLPAITAKDKKDIEFGIEQGIDFIAASFVRKASDVLAIREILEEHNATNIQIISKIENQEGVDNIDEILEVSDGLMVARGDLGVEIPTEDIPIVQKELIKKCNILGKPVITATQMLDSMIRNPRPTRAEVTDVANAIFDGTDAIMLSGETAAGKYPLESVKTMASIAIRAEQTLDYEELLKTKVKLRQLNITNAISHATCTTAIDLKASAIISATASGYTARMVSSYRPSAPIIAATNSEMVMRQMGLVWGVYPLLTEKGMSTDDVFEKSVQSALDMDYISSGDLVVITAGVPVGIAGTTNLINVHIASEILIRGVGVGTTNISGRARLITDSNMEIEQGDIIVASSTDKDMMNIINKASAIITEEGGLTSHAAVVGVSLGIPVIVSATNALKIIEDNETITIDAQSGLVYKGEVRML
ncbi:pyruvate kinase I [Acetoanaerobium sticklandii]|uniref:Pyruvate kinase n=1 Tax=Acetoanaerobium sticklandii (strain ATCC 12662 / DSM 519 / JCM 1433 / CCUG 9281 / NCIMB 10654 / HF) TaxID=499177 RepID=E3PSB3_ACESD|nr:pyruvate kinase [Acetoanaerobium sticklandii]CBH21767.1 pyruvate kinase I [Acetoanaerobium sticklandii]